MTAATIMRCQSCSGTGATWCDYCTGTGLMTEADHIAFLQALRDEREAEWAEDDRCDAIDEADEMRREP